MAQSTILAAGTEAADSSEVTIAAGSSVNLCLFVASGDIPSDAVFTVGYKTPGSWVPLAQLSGSRPAVNVVGPCIVRVSRIECGKKSGVSVGVLSDS